MAERVLAKDPETLKAIEAENPAATRPGLCTIGYEGSTLENYLNRLLRDGVTLLCDVRRNPLSRKYGFSKGTLAKACEGVGIRYDGWFVTGILMLAETESVRSFGHAWTEIHDGETWQRFDATSPEERAELLWIRYLPLMPLAVEQLVRRHLPQRLARGCGDLLLALGRVLGERLGVPDRTVVYYFPTKTALLTAVLDHHAGHLRALLHATVGDTPLPPAELLHRMWSALRTPQADAAFRVLFEVTGHAAAGRAPYRELAATLVAQWTDWLALHLPGSTDQRRGHAAALLAQLDGLLLLRSIGHGDLADTAAHTLSGLPLPEAAGSAAAGGGSPAVPVGTPPLEFGP